MTVLEARARPIEGGRARVWIRAVRAHQWVKNVLVAVPLLAAHKWNEPALLIKLAVAFAAFSLCASAVYLFNDLCDMAADREHPVKRHRPLAAGLIPVPAAVAAGMGLLGLSIGAAGWVGMPFLGILGAYFVLTTAYSFYLKRRLLLDVITLAGLYTARIVAGGAAVGVIVSHWLLAFSMFLFLSLAFVKRYMELRMLQENRKRHAKGRSYITDDLDIVLSVGPTCGYLAVLVMCLYISSEDATRHYHYPLLLWGICPVLLYWVTRIWFLARRGELVDDPIRYAVKDRVSLLSGVLVMALIVGSAVL